MGKKQVNCKTTLKHVYKTSNTCKHVKRLNKCTKAKQMWNGIFLNVRNVKTVKTWKKKEK